MNHANPAMRALRLYNVRVGKDYHRVWATSECHAIAEAHGMGLPATSARRVA